MLASVTIRSKKCSDFVWLRALPQCCIPIWVFPHFSISNMLHFTDVRVYVCSSTLFLVYQCSFNKVFFSPTETRGKISPSTSLPVRMWWACVWWCRNAASRNLRRSWHCLSWARRQTLIVSSPRLPNSCKGWEVRRGKYKAKTRVEGISGRDN